MIIATNILSEKTGKNNYPILYIEQNYLLVRFTLLSIHFACPRLSKNESNSAAASADPPTGTAEEGSVTVAGMGSVTLGVTVGGAGRSKGEV